MQDAPVMSEKDREIFEFEGFRLNVAEHFLVRSVDGERVQLSEKAFQTLRVLVQNAGHLVQKDELLNQVWADSFVEENNLNKCIHAVRRALGERGDGIPELPEGRSELVQTATEPREVQPRTVNARQDHQRPQALTAWIPGLIWMIRLRFCAAA